MQVLSAKQIQLWDKHTITHEPIASIDLMERAATAASQWILAHTRMQKFVIFCGKGNNGGDGLAMARILSQAKRQVRCVLLDDDKKCSADYKENKSYGKLQGIEMEVASKAEPIASDEAIIDALFGTGFQPRGGASHPWIEKINAANNFTISIDVPSGLPTDSLEDKAVQAVQADITLTFQCAKISFINRDNHTWLGKLVVLDIGLSSEFEADADWTGVDESMATQLMRKRSVLVEKKQLGKALLIGGEVGMAGAVVLAAKAALYAGCGLTYACSREDNRVIMQQSVPEVIFKSWKVLSDLDLENFTVGIGPGLGVSKDAKDKLEFILKQEQPAVIDADALNILAEEGWQNRIPKESIITPHQREFDRLFGASKNDIEVLEKQLAMSKSLGITIVLKGYMTRMTSPNGHASVLLCGNSGMAKGSSGDALTGLITGIAASGYSMHESAQLGAYLHSYAADLAANQLSERCVTASAIIHHLPQVWRQLEQNLS